MMRASTPLSTSASVGGSHSNNNSRLGQRRGGQGPRQKISLVHLTVLLVAAACTLMLLALSVVQVNVDTEAETEARNEYDILTTTTTRKSVSGNKQKQKQQQQQKQTVTAHSNVHSETETETNGLPTISASTVRPVPTATIAYAISLIKCGDFQSSTAGMNDAALVLRHSIHQNSIRATADRDQQQPQQPHVSTYDYKMYAIVHTNAVPCSQGLADAGFELIIRDAPVQKADIQGAHLRHHIHKEWCCGADEFIKLYAYTLPEPIVVHVDVDYVMHQPMDLLFDAMLPTTIIPPAQQERARQKIPLEILHNGNATVTDTNTVWPSNVTAFMTRDWPQVMPGRKPGYQAGFLVIQPDPTVFDELTAIIQKGDYVEGFQRANGWGGLGYGGFVGAMAMQGLLAYYYDVHRPDSWMELNQCRFNHMGMDVLYRSQPAFRPNHKKKGLCRNDLDYCEDCMHTPLDQIYNIHYTQCRKPWNCIGLGSNMPGSDKKSIPEDSVHFDHCMELLTVWHSHRSDLERKLLALTGDETIEEGRNSDYNKQVFQGHCSGEGQESYHVLSEQGRPETWKRLAELYA
jgi:hypothetical protein